MVLHVCYSNLLFLYDSNNSSLENTMEMKIHNNILQIQWNNMEMFEFGFDILVQ